MRLFTGVPWKERLPSIETVQNTWKWLIAVIPRNEVWTPYREKNYRKWLIDYMIINTVANTKCTTKSVSILCIISSKNAWFSKLCHCILSSKFATERSLTSPSADWKCETWKCGTRKNAGLENAGMEKCGTKLQGWKMRDIPAFSPPLQFCVVFSSLAFSTPCRFVTHFPVLHFHVSHFQRPRLPSPHTPETLRHCAISAIIMQFSKKY